MPSKFLLDSKKLLLKSSAAVLVKVSNTRLILAGFYLHPVIYNDLPLFLILFDLGDFEDDFLVLGLNPSPNS